MSAQLEQITLGPDESFFIGIFQNNLEQSTWHYHNTFEISFITKGKEKRIIGDSIEDFQPGDLVFIGRRLPHVWIADKEWGEQTLETVFLQFSDQILDSRLLGLPEFRYAAQAVSLSERGVQIVGHTLNEISRLMLQMPYLSGFERMLHFLRILDTIGRSQCLIPLAGKDYMRSRFIPANKRIGQIHEYLMNHYKHEIDLAAIADTVNMAEGSLCRFFKNHTGVTLFQYLNRLKIDLACKMLLNPESSILEICMDSGYNNLSYFNKQFKKHTGRTPSQFRAQLQGVVRSG